MRESLALLRQHRFEDVLARCVPVLDAHPTYVPLRLLVCQALIGLRRDTEAEAHLRYCLDLDPECGAAHRFLGELALGREHLDAAARHLDTACQLCPGDREARDLRIIVGRRRRRLARGTDGPGLRSERPVTLRDGFGDYLAEIGLLSRAQVRAALIYRRTRGVDLGGAAVALGFASESSLRTAASAYYGSGQDDRS